MFSSQISTEKDTDSHKFFKKKLIAENEFFLTKCFKSKRYQVREKSVKLILNIEIMDIQTKKNLITAILQTSDDEILNEIKKLLRIEDSYDFWDELTEEDQLAINEGIRQLDQGKSFSHEEVKDLMKSKFNF